jgi:hypothetical protein
MLSWDEHDGASLRDTSPHRVNGYRDCGWSPASPCTAEGAYGWTGWQSPRWLRGSQQSDVLKQS